MTVLMSSDTRKAITFGMENDCCPKHLSDAIEGHEIEINESIEYGTILHPIECANELPKVPEIPLDPQRAIKEEMFLKTGHRDDPNVGPDAAGGHHRDWQ